MSPIPWRYVVIASLIGTLIAVAAVLVDVDRKGGNPLSLVEPGDRGPSADLFHEDFPETDLPDGTGHDGQQFYAIARSPMHLDEAAEHLDRPHYRLQRPLYSWLAWALHPGGGGLGLVRAMFAVGIVAAFAGAVATGALSTSLGGPAWPAALFPVLPGAYLSVRIGVADGLAVALVLAAVALAVRGRHRWAVMAAVGAVLAKEPVLLVLAGYALWRRDRRAVALVGIPVAVASLWALFLRVAVEGSGTQVREFTWPVGGILDGVSRWSRGDDLWALGAVAVGVVAGAAALSRTGLRSPLGWLGWPIALHLALVPLLGVDVIALDLNSTRALLPLHVLALIALAAPSRPQHEGAPAEGGDGGPGLVARSGVDRGGLVGEEPRDHDRQL